MNTIGERIRYQRQLARLSQEQLAEKMGKSAKQIVSNWETNRSEPALSDLKKLAQLFDCPLLWLIEGEVGPVVVQDVAPGKVIMDASEVIALQRELLELRAQRVNNMANKQPEN